MDNLNRNERNLLYHNQQHNRVNNNNNRNNADLPMHLQKTRDYDVNMYDRGRNWQKNGLPLSGASDEFKRNINFVKGYNRENQISGIVGKRKDGLK